MGAGLHLTRADAVLPDEAGRAPGPAPPPQGSGARSEGGPGVVGSTGGGHMRPQPRCQGGPVADGGHVLSTPLQRGAGLAVTQEGVAWRAQAAVAALEVVALVGTGPGQLQALVDIWKAQAGCRGGLRARRSLPAFPGVQLPRACPLLGHPGLLSHSGLHCSEASTFPRVRVRPSYLLSFSETHSLLSTLLLLGPLGRGPCRVGLKFGVTEQAEQPPRPLVSAPSVLAAICQALTRVPTRGVGVPIPRQGRPGPWLQ